jgi:hypothetical protein
MKSLLKIALESQTCGADPLEAIKSILNHQDLNSLDQVRFAYHCAEDLDQYYDNEKYSDLKAKRAKCLKIVANYLVKGKISTKEIEELKAAAYAANAAANAANAAANAANAAANAANAAAGNKKRKKLLNFLCELIIKKYNTKLAEKLYLYANN